MKKKYATGEMRKLCLNLTFLLGIRDIYAPVYWTFPLNVAHASNLLCLRDFLPPTNFPLNVLVILGYFSVPCLDSVFCPLCDFVYFLPLLGTSTTPSQPLPYPSLLWVFSVLHAPVVSYISNFTTLTTPFIC